MTLTARSSYGTPMPAQPPRRVCRCDPSYREACHLRWAYPGWWIAMRCAGRRERKPGTVLWLLAKDNSRPEHPSAETDPRVKT